MPHVIKAMPFQKEFIFCPARFMALMAGRRAGKTEAIKARIKVRTRRPGFRYTYITPLSYQALEVYRQLTSDLTYKHNIKRQRERPFPHYFTRSGSVVNFRSMQRPEGLRSTGEDEICGDETQDNVYTERDLDTIIMPMLSDRRGSLVLAGQFRGDDWRYKRFWVPGQETIDGKPNPKNQRPLYWSWQVPSSAGYVFNTQGGPEELALQKSLIPAGVWEQEWACIPTANSKAVFPSAQIKAISHGDATLTPRVGRTYIMGLDLGRVVDRSAIVVLEVETGTIVYAHKLPQRMEHATQAKEAAKIAGTFRACVVIDVTGGATGGHAHKDSYAQFYRQHIRDLREFYWQKANKEKVISQLSLEIEQKQISIPEAHTELLKELSAYEYEYKHGYYDYHAPKNEHDDYVAALAMAVWGRKCGWAGRGNGGNLGQLLY